MNKQTFDILQIMMAGGVSNQRILAQESGYSLGTVNKAVRQLKESGYLDGDGRITLSAQKEMKEKRTKNAVILAAGFGLRMIPVNREVPKALLNVKGEVMIERQIRHLHEAGIHEIHVVTGFMKEQFEYLVDDFGVDLIVNPAYVYKNNLHSLNCASKHLGGTYIVPCDIWCRSNPFHAFEDYSWYMVSSKKSVHSDIHVNRRGELFMADDETPGNEMIGISYINMQDGARLRDALAELAANPRNDAVFWEEALRSKHKIMTLAKVVEPGETVEINTYEQLRELDSGSENLKSDVLQVIADRLQAGTEDITGIEVLKKGMTNRSFVFRCKGQKYIMRVPGEGTSKLINRAQEADVYAAISGRGLCDDPEYIDPASGYKITRYLEGARTCQPDCEEDLVRCMGLLRKFHQMKLRVRHEFDLFGQIEFYESLWDGRDSVYRDYRTTKQNVLSLRPYIEEHAKEKVLTHIDAVADNFLFYREADGAPEALQLTDWEYAGMQDPDVDIAMFCIYALYGKEEADHLIDLYYEGGCDTSARAMIYCYIAACGLLWSNWCEYKRQLGIEFGEYSLRQYRYAKEYYKHAIGVIGDGA